MKKTSRSSERRIGDIDPLVPPRSLTRVLREYSVDLEPERGREIYCNRALDLSETKVIGFDMDHTLAVYNQAEIDRLSRAGTLRNLAALGYDVEQGIQPMPDEFAIRGLVIDKHLGNILKMDRHKWVGKAYHGRRRMSRQEIQEIYRQQRQGSGESRFAFVDTLFELSEVLLLAEMVQAIDENVQIRKDVPTYEELWQDIRKCTDQAHRDGSLKRDIVADLPRFIDRDPELPRTLHRLRSAGKKLFLLTNSEPEYTDPVMRHLIPDGWSGYADWRSYFDWIVVSAQKPRFFKESSPFVDLQGTSTYSPEPNTVYAGGNHVALQHAIGVHEDEILYVGDHIYADILQTKKGCGWRTALILKDLEHDLAVRKEQAATLKAFESARSAIAQLTKDLARQRYLHYLLVEEDRTNGKNHTAEIEDLRRRMVDLERHRAEISSYVSRLTRVLDRSFNRFWGSIFSEGVNASLFAAQAQSYACIYTSRVTNFLHVSPAEYFHSMPQPLPHF